MQVSVSGTLERTDGGREEGVEEEEEERPSMGDGDGSGAE